MPQNNSLVEGENAQYCTECEDLKPFDEFHKANKSKYGYHPHCKKCRKDKYWKRKKSKLLKNSISNNYEKFRDLLNQSRFCSKCDEYKSFDCFHEAETGNYGLRSKCASCRYEDDLEYSKKYYQENKEKRLATSKRWKEENEERWREYSREYNKKNRKRYNKLDRERYRNNPQYRIINTQRNRIRYALKNNSKSKTTKELLGCSSKRLREHIEEQFEEGMTWENHGFDGWHIDHIIPCDTFDMTDSKQQAVCFHHSNLQPLWEEHNIEKSDKIPNLFEGVEVDVENLISL